MSQAQTRKQMEEPFGLDQHGGDLADAAQLAENEQEGLSEPWLDLSTGISPTSYAVPGLSPETWSRLPGRSELAELREAARAYYGAPDADHVVAGPGSESLIQRLPELFKPRTVAIVGPTYLSHGEAWQRAGHRLRQISVLSDARPEEIAVIVNPNNPDGRWESGEALERACGKHSASGGWLIVDEAFGDVELGRSMAHACRSNSVMVLRSAGKFFGLAGLRLGFAVAPLIMAKRLREALGEWALSGPAIAIGTRCLRDEDWQRQQRAELDEAARRLDGILTGAGLAVVGGTILFRLVEAAAAPRLFRHLLTKRIYVRRFGYNRHWLRIGMPAAGADFSRLKSALETFEP